ncbi:unnamed protein product [Effrenium voratum]|uniref:Uncharacterized protein n=1 Tax=Effrenium voratum TaxID=2562239 RepID=A0AA36JKV3_9DINO|nr:unnamed protein product [Effrenium voratum]CAJ1406899.1 unnamed protein product [Effrenium voratum]CAJ1424608.1 unnamed protein product [Effrenium voratum]
MGFKIEEIVHPDEQRFAGQFVCSVCLCIMSEPMQTICDHVFCSDCITPCLACPSCRTPLAAKDRRPLRECNRPLLRMMHDLKVWCPYHRHSKVVNVDAVEEGTLAGESAGGRSPKRQRLDDSEFCSWEGSYTDLLASHLAECQLHLVPCPQCGQRLRRRKLAEHGPSCPKNFEECPICRDEVKCGNMLAHRKEKAELHVQLLEAKLLDAGDGVEDLCKEIRNKLTDLQSDSQRATKLDRVQAELKRHMCLQTELLSKTLKDVMKKGMTQIWEIEGVPSLLQKYPRRGSLESEKFCLGAHGPFFIQFYPNGDAQSQAGKCGLFLWGPDSILVKARWALNAQERFIDFGPVKTGWGSSDMFLTPLGCSTVKISVEVLEVVRHMKTII